MFAEWFGGPFDGQVVDVAEDRAFFAVAYDDDGQPLPGWPSLQGFASDPHYIDPMASVFAPFKVVIYPVINGHVWFSETSVVIVDGGQ